MGPEVWVQIELLCFLIEAAFGVAGRRHPPPNNLLGGAQLTRPEPGLLVAARKEVLLYHRRHTEAALAGDHYHPGRCHLDSSHFDSTILYESVLIVRAHHWRCAGAAGPFLVLLLIACIAFLGAVLSVVIVLDGCLRRTVAVRLWRVVHPRLYLHASFTTRFNGR